MSLVLYAEPVKPPEPHCLGGHPLKGLLCAAYGQYDGSVQDEFVLSSAAIPTLEVLLRLHGDDAEIREGLTWLIDALREHIAVRLWTDE